MPYKSNSSWLRADLFEADPLRNLSAALRSRTQELQYTRPPLAVGAGPVYPTFSGSPQNIVPDDHKSICQV